MPQDTRRKLVFTVREIHSLETRELPKDPFEGDRTGAWFKKNEIPRCTHRRYEQGTLIDAWEYYFRHEAVWRDTFVAHLKECVRCALAIQTLRSHADLIEAVWERESEMD